MASLTLLEGPAGAGKSQVAIELLQSGAIDLMADLTAIYVALKGIERGADGKYPIRENSDPVLQVANYVRSVVVRNALDSDLNVAVSTGTPNMAVKWSEVAAERGASFSVQTIDPGIETVRERLAVDGVLSDQCESAIGRWYG